MTARNFSASCKRQAAVIDSQTRLVAAMIVSRPPLLLKPLTKFESTFYAYSRQLRGALADEFDRAFYFRPGSSAEKTYLEGAPASQEDLQPDMQRDGSVTSLNRQFDRTLYLLLRKERNKGEAGEWQFREQFCNHLSLPSHLSTAQGGIENSDPSVLQAALRELSEECGGDMDLFTPAQVPAAVYNYSTPSLQRTKVDPVMVH